MQHQSYSVFKKLKSAAKKSIVFTLIFLFAFSPVLQAFAAEETAVSVPSGDVIVNGNISTSDASRKKVRGQVLTYNKSYVKIELCLGHLE